MVIVQFTGKGIIGGGQVAITHNGGVVGLRRTARTAVANVDIKGRELGVDGAAQLGPLAAVIAAIAGAVAGAHVDLVIAFQVAWHRE